MATNVEDLLSRVTSVLADEQHKDIFAVGGRIDTTDSQTLRSVTLRWDPKAASDDAHAGRRVSLPIRQDSRDEDAFRLLLEDCSPARFGLGQKDVLDESYRKAGKMDTDHFCSNFGPYENDIMRLVTQTLAQGRQGDKTTRGLRAELYKLNVYSAPYGKFKSHVDTPRSDQQMGSLVVCLPYKHSGGQLAVRHAGNERIFDWGPESVSSVQWAAFFSDCEHEVLDVTEGHRVTLTYNLYWTSAVPAPLGSFDETSLRFSAVKDLLNHADFLPDGGLVGFACAHAYPHTSSSAADTLPSMLKGLDMAVYQVLSRLAASARVAVYLHDERYREHAQELWDDIGDEWRATGRYPVLPDPASATLGDVSEVEPFLWEGGYDDTMEDPATFHREPRWDANGRINAPGLYKRPSVTWLNHRPANKTNKQLAVAYLAYGNEASIGAYYSSAVLIAEVKPAAERQL